MSKSVSEEQPRSRLKIFLWTCVPVLAVAVILGVPVYLTFTPLVQNSYDISNFISDSGNNWLPVSISVVLGFMAVGFNFVNVGKNPHIKLSVLITIALEIIAALTVFYAAVRPQYSYLKIETPDSEMFYFGTIMGDDASGQGRIFDKEKRLLYRGEFDKNEYSGYGELYAYDQEYTFKKEPGKDPHLIYEGEFYQGKYHGQGTLYGEDNTGTGSFQNGKYNGYVECWYKSEDGEPYMYKGYYWDGLFHGPGLATWPNGSIHNEGIYEKGHLVYGTYCTEDGTLQYFGQWSDHNVNGIGTWYHTNGNPSYYGDLVDSKREGYGTKYQEDGVKKIYEGNWKDDKYNGYGTAYQSDGKTVDKEGWFVDNEYYGPEPPSEKSSDSAGGGGINIILDN